MAIPITGSIRTNPFVQNDLRMNPVWKRSFGSLPNDTNLSPTMFSPRDPSRVVAAEANGTAYSLKPSTPIFSPRAIISSDSNATAYSLKSISPTFSPQAVLTADSNATAYSLKSISPTFSPQAVLTADSNATAYSLKSISPTFSPQAVLTADSNATAYSLKSVTPDYSLTNGVSPAPDTDTAVDVNDNEITYGPGIVQKLRDKFAEMSNIATQNVRISPHSKRKRFPSADDILSDETENRDQTPYRPENYLLKNSANKSVSETSVEASSSPKVEKGEQSKKFVVESMQHRSDAIYDDSKSLPAQFPAAHYTAHEEPPPRVQISSLREKFEVISQQTKPASTTKSTAIWNRTTRSYSTPPHTYESDEPEFIRVQRRIRSQSRDQVLADITPSDGSYRNRFIRPAFLAVKKEQKMIEPETKDSWGLPQLKGSARIIVQSPPKDESSAKSGHPLPVRVAELISPPDPDTARHSLPEPTPPPHYEPTEPSPPPEEPKPLTIDVNEVENRNEEYVQKGTEKILSPSAPPSLYFSPNSLKISEQLDDRSGLDEMHRLLSKFSINRESKPIDDEEKNETTKTKPAESSDILRLLSSSARSLTKFDTENEQKLKFEDRSLKEEKNERKVEEAVNQNFPKTEIDRHVGKSFFQTDDLPKVEPLSRPATLLKDQTPMFSPIHIDDHARDSSTARSWTTRAFTPKNSDILMLLSPTAQIQPLPKFHPHTNSSENSNDSGPQPESVLKLTSPPATPVAELNDKPTSPPISTTIPHVNSSSQDHQRPIFKTISPPISSIPYVVESKQSKVPTEMSPQFASPQTSSAQPLLTSYERTNESNQNSLRLMTSSTSETLPSGIKSPPAIRSPPISPPWQHPVSSLPSSFTYSHSSVPIKPLPSAYSQPHPHQPPPIPERVGSVTLPPLVSTVDSQRKSLTAKFLENKQQQQQQEQQSVIKAADSSEIETDEETYNESNDVKQADVDEDDDDDRVNPFDIWKSRVDGGETPAVPTNKTNDHHGSLVQTTIEKFSRQRVAENVSFDDEPLNGIRSSYSNTTAGDGNPVRHSLISLVPEEDVPLLLEAMAEKLNFEFEDVTSTPSSSNEGIIHDTNERQQRRKIRNVTRIEFKTTPPAVFTYPDESTASESAEWCPGEDITFDQYQKICETEKELSEQKRVELSKWQTYMDHGTVDLNSLVSANPASPTATDCELGVTSRISYDSPPVVMVTNNFTPNNLSPLIAGK